MANNGYLAEGVCYPSPIRSLSCPSNGPVVAAFSSDGGNSYFRYSCYTTQLTSVYVGTISIAPNCEILSPPLTETQQIEAINALFPSAIAILAIAWGFKYIRVLVAEWLKERNASD